MSTPSRPPVFFTVNDAITTPAAGPAMDRPLVENVVYERPKANGKSGLKLDRSRPGGVASLGQVTGSLPLGSYLPNSTSAVPLPVCVLPCHAIRIAFADSASGPSPRGRPAQTTTITDLPVARSAAINAFWLASNCGAGSSPSPSA